jgi:hypothetical protein
MEALGAQIEINQRYRHYKTGQIYAALGFTVLEATDEIAVRYADIEEPDVEFIRPVSSWLDVIDGSPRFDRVNSSN